MTNPWTDIKNTDLVIVMGGNAAEAHPCGFKWVTEAKAQRGARLIVVDPRYTRTASVADYYAPIRPGSDIAFLMGAIRWCMENDKVQWDYVRNYTNASFLVREDFGWSDGLFTGYDEEKRDYDKESWDYQIGEDGYALTDPTLQDPRCVWQMLRQHVDVYTPEFVENITGTPRDKFLDICAMIGECSAPDRTMTSMYALGWTQHSKGAQNIRGMAMLQLILGNIGVRGGGMNALRGHSNIQGLTDIGLMSNLIPGYLNIPTERERDWETYLSTRSFTPLRPGQTSYWQNYPNFMVSFLKAMWGDAATEQNDWAFDYLPKLDVPAYDVLRMFELMNNDRVNIYFCQGFNPMLSFPDRGKVTRGLSRLKLLVVMDPLSTETSHFWQNHGAHNDVPTAEIQTEVLELPTTCFAEDEGALVNSGRWLQWHWPGATPPGQAKHDTWIMAQIWTRVRDLYRTEGGAFPDPIVNLSWDYADPGNPMPEELAREMNGRALSDVTDPATGAVVVPAGQQVSGFGQLRADGTTMAGCWIYAGSWTEDGNMMARRDNSDPDATGMYLNWAFAWPANRRVLYNRASADLQGRPWDATRPLVQWNGERWTGYDIPDIAPTADPSEVGPFIMNQEGVSRLFTRGMMRDGPFPTHMEPFESPMANVFNPRMRGNPVARMFASDAARLGSSEEFPLVATSYRLTEHFHYWTKHNPVNAALQPEFFVEISEELAAERGIAKGGRVRVWGARGQVWAKAVVTKRIRPLTCDGKTVHVVGIPLHWGFMGAAKKGWGPNSLTPFVGDANVETPEFKAFLVNIEPAAEEPVA